MIIGIIYSLVEEISQGFDVDKLADNEITQTLQLFTKALEVDHRVVPIRVRFKDFFSLNFQGFDFIFNLCESIEGNPEGEALIAVYIENQGVPFSGSDHLTLGMCLNKVKTKQLLLANGLESPNYQVFQTSQDFLIPEINFPLIVKPMLTDASIGISFDSVVKSESELRNKLQFIIHNYHQPALVEEFIDGRELNVAIIGNGKKAQCLPISEIIFNLPKGTPNILDYESKWVEDSSHYQNTVGKCPAHLSKPEHQKLCQSALKAYEIMGCRDYARVDIRLRNGVPYILEVNPNPGINIDSGFFRSFKTSGENYKGMIVKLCEITLNRYSMELVHSIPRSLYYSSDRLDFYLVEITDIPQLYKWFNRLDVKQFMDEPNTLETEESLIKSYFLSVDEGYNFMIREKQKKSWIGYGSIYNVSRWNQTAEFSYLIGDRESLHQGYGKEMVLTLKDIALKKLAINRLVATVTINNTASITILKQTRFRQVGILQESHYFEDDKMDEILFEYVGGPQEKRNFID